MSFALDIFCFSVPLMMLFDAVLSFATSVGGSGWTISSRAVLMDAASWKFSNNPPNSASLADSMTFFTMLNYICTGPFFGGIAYNGVLDFVPRKNIHRICFVPLILICSMHPNICGESFRFFCIVLMRLDFLRCNFKIELFFLRFWLLALSVPPPVSLVPPTLWCIWLYHNIGIFQQKFWSLFDYFHPIIQLVIFLIAYDCFPHRWVVSRGLVITGVFWVFCVGKNVVLHVHILELEVRPCLFHIPTSVLLKCKILLPNLWLPCIYLLAILSGVRHALFPNILPQSHRITRQSWLVKCCVSKVPGFCSRGVIHMSPGVLLGNNVLFVPLEGVLTLP